MNQHNDQCAEDIRNYGACEHGKAFPETPGTVDPNRVVPQDEAKALVALETVERLVARAHSLLGQEPLTENDVTRIQALLESAIDISTRRTVTAVKKQDLSDRISRLARDEVAKVVADVEKRMLPIEETFRFDLDDETLDYDHGPEVMTPTAWKACFSATATARATGSSATIFEVLTGGTRYLGRATRIDGPGAVYSVQYPLPQKES